MIGFFKAFAASIALLQPGGGAMDLDEAIRIATENSYSIKINRSVEEQRRQAIAARLGSLGPQISLGATYTRFDEEQSTSFPIGNGQTVTTVVQPIDSKQANASVNVPFDISGNLSRLVRAARAQLRASEFDTRSTERDLKRDVRLAYYSVLRAERLIEVSRQAVANAEERVKNARIRDNVGTIDPIELKRFETELEQSKADLISAENNLALAKSSFNLTLSRAVDEPVQLVDVTAIPNVPENPGPLFARATSEREEVQSLERTGESLALVRRAQEQGTNPSLGLSLTHTRNLGNIGANSRRNNSTAVLAFSFPIFDSGITRANVKSARQDEEQIRLQLKQVKLQIGLEVQQALINLKNARETLDVSEVRVGLARETYRLATVRRANDVGTFLEVVDAQTQLTQAENGLISARYDYLIAWAQLQRAIGSDDVAAAATMGEKK
jgi:outer membrane protein